MNSWRVIYFSSSFSYFVLYIFLLGLGGNTSITTSLKISCPTNSSLTRNITSPNKATAELNLFVISFLLDKDKIGGTIHKDVHNNSNEFQNFCATN